MTMNKLVLLWAFTLTFFGLKGNISKPDSSTAPMGISFNLFPNVAAIGLEYQPRKSANNIFGIGTGFTVYYLRQLSGINKHIIVGVPLVLNQKNIGIKEPNQTSNSYNFISVAPLVGWQFVLGQKQNFKLRATYSPIHLSWIRDVDKNISRDLYFHRLGFGVAYHLEGKQITK